MSNLRHLLVCTSTAFLILSGGMSGSESPPRNLEPEDYFRIKYVEGPQISPEGDEIAYSVTTYDLEEEESTTQIWTVPIEGGASKPMTTSDHSSSQPRYSSDGKYIAFVSDRDDSESQIWLLPRRGGEARAVTEVKQGVGATVFLDGAAADAGGYEWSPDAKRILMVVKDPRPDQEEPGEGEDENDKKDKVPEPWVINRQQFKLDYEGYLDHRRSHVYVIDIDTRNLTQVTSGDFDDMHPTWSADGKQIAFASNRSDNPDATYNTDIWVVEADNTDQGASAVRLTDNPGADRHPVWSPNGKTIVFVTSVDPDVFFYASDHLAVVDVEARAVTLLTEAVDRNVSSPDFSPNGSANYFSLEAQGEQILARLPVEGGTVERLITGTDVLSSYDIGPNGEIAALIARPNRPAEVFVLQDGNLAQRTDVNADLFSELQLGSMEKIDFSSPDGTRIEAFVVKPPGFESGRRYPTVLSLHGGPQSQYDARFPFDEQLWAASGYLVVMPNPRGSTGYGQKFCQALWRDWGGVDFEDVMAAIDSVIDRGWADPGRLAVTGWSYGGMLTNHVITKTDRFKAAVTGASGTLYVVNYGHDHYQRWWEAELGLPWEPESRELWERLSPFNGVQNVVTPTLIVGGEHDWNVPIINSEQLFMALRRLGVDTELVVYPGEHHTISKPSYVLDLSKRYLAWFSKYLGSG